MKKILSLFIALYMVVGLTVYANEAESVENQINLGSPQLLQSQGDNGWYFCQYASGNVSELTWSDEIKGWTSPGEKMPEVTADELLPGVGTDLDFKFVPNSSGMYTLRWDISWKYGTNSSSDGMIITVLNNDEVLYEKNMKVTESTDCKVTVMLAEGDEVHFRMNCKAQRWNDSFVGLPSVELAGTFYQKNESGMKQLSYNKEKDLYIADDNLARISDKAVMPTEEYSVVKRNVVLEQGRYRLFGKISSKDKNGGGNVIKIYKNDKLIREQLCLCGEDTLIDLRMLCEKNDVVDIEVGIAEYEGFNYSTWNLELVNIPGTIRDLANTTTSGYSYNVVSSTKLSDYIAGAQTNGVGLFTEINEIRYPMAYDDAAKRWEETSVDNTGVTRIPKNSRETLEEYKERIVIKDAGYVSSNIICSTKNWNPGSYTVIDVPITESGCLLVSGNFRLTQETDAELVKVYLNDECVWSNRIGGEESISYDEPYDTKYFIDNIHTLLNVSEGDVLSFRFNKWRKHSAAETVDISNVKLQYVEGGVLSKTTKWKLENSVVIDTLTGNVYVDGKCKYSGAYLSNGSTYIPSNVANELFGYDAESTSGAVAVRTATENSQNTVVWIANRYAVVHGGIPGMFTWNEMSEIGTYSEMNGGGLFE